MSALSNILKFDRHTHRPCFYMAIAMGLGIWLGRYNFCWPFWSILSGIFIILSLARTRLARVGLYLATICLGAFCYQNVYLLPSNHIGFISYQDRHRLTALEGTIDSDVQSKPMAFGTKQMFELQIGRIRLGDQWQTATGRILIDFYGSARFARSPLCQPLVLSYGDQVILSGSLHKAFSSPLNRFSYQQYLEDHGLFWILSVSKYRTVQILSQHHGHWWIAASFKFKHRLKNILAQYLEPRETGMIQAMVLGDRSFLPKDMYALFAKTGTAHILAISGMNMAIIGSIVLFIFKLLHLPRPWQFILTIALLFAYALLSGWTASVVRSVFMATVILSSFCLEYEADTANSLGLAAIILFVMNPLNLFDLGFQLSFVSVGVIIYLYPLVYRPIAHYFKGGILKSIIQVLCISLVAWVGIGPLIAYDFDIVSPIAIIANFPIVPLADLVVALVAATATKRSSFSKTPVREFLIYPLV